MRRKNKHIYVNLVILVLFGISVGYAVLNRALSINGNSEVKQNTWNIHFDNIQIKNGSVTATTPPTTNGIDPSIGFAFQLDLPGDFYEFTVDVVNEGTIDAMLDSIVKNPELTEQQAKYLNYIIEYQNGEQITSKQLVKNGEFVKLKVRVEYRKDINAEDLPTTAENLNLSFSINYVQSDESGIKVKDNGVWVAKANGSLDAIGTIVTIGSEQFYTIGTEGDNVKLLSMYNLYVGSECTSSESPSCTPYGSEAIGMQDENMKGFIYGEPTRKGVVAFSNDTKKGTNRSDYKGSVVEEYVNNYKTKLEQNFDVEVVEARLITYEELISDDIGCSSSTEICSNAPDFIYLTSFWTGTAFDLYKVWRFHVNDRNNDYAPALVPRATVYDYTTGVRPVILIPKSDIKIEVKPVADGSLDDIGTIVTIGTEQFYTIGTEGDNVKLFSMYNLYVGNECISDSSDSCTSYGEEATGMQNPNMRGYVSINKTRNGTISFSNDEQKGKNYSSYNGSIVENYVNNYKIEIEKMGVAVEEARLITKNELMNSETFNCSVDNWSCLTSPYPWIYSTSYWTGSSSVDITIWMVISYGSFDTRYYYTDYEMGVRPVIVVSKSLF